MAGHTESLCLRTSPSGKFTCYLEADHPETRLPKCHSFTDEDGVEHCWDDSGKEWDYPSSSPQRPIQDDFPDGYYCDYLTEGGS